MRAFFIPLSKAIIATVYKNHFKQIISRILKSSSHDNSNNCGHIINRWTYFINGLPFIDLSFFASRKVSTYLNLTLDQCHACSDLPCSGHLRHDYLIKYTYFVKCYLKRFASISDPEKWTTNVAQWEKHVKRDFKYHVTLLRQWRHKTSFPKRGRVVRLTLRNFHHQNIT